MSAHNGGIEHLDQMGRCAHLGQRVEEGFEHTGLAQPVKAPPHRVPMAEAFRQCTPAHILHREKVHRFQKQSVVRGFAAAPWQAGPENLSAFAQSVSVIFVDIVDLQISRQSMNQTGFVSGTPKPIPESIRPHGLALQLRFCFDVGSSCRGLMCSPPERPSDDV